MIKHDGVTLNREMLRLMEGMNDDLVYRNSSGKDVRRGRNFNQPVGHRAEKLADAGLAERGEDGKWTLTELGRAKKTEAEQAYAQRSAAAA